MKVHNDFRLIVVADKNAVYNTKKYPIPLVNRLEKHLLNLDSVLNEKMKQMIEALNVWCSDITRISEEFAGLQPTVADKQSRLKPSDLFVGFTLDTLPSLVYKRCQEERYQRLFSAHNGLDYDAEHDKAEVSFSL